MRRVLTILLAFTLTLFGTGAARFHPVIGPTPPRVVTVPCVLTVPISVPNDTSEHTLLTCAVTGGTLGANGYIRATTVWALGTADAGNARTVRMRVNGTEFSRRGLGNNVIGRVVFHWFNMNSESAQRYNGWYSECCLTVLSGVNVLQVALGLATENTAANFTITISCQKQVADSNDTCTLTEAIVEQGYAP